jgi:cysteine-rich repeat protein
MEPIHNKKILIVSTIGFLCLGLTIGSLINLNPSSLSSSAIPISALENPTLKCSITCPNGVTIDAEQSCPTVCGNGIVEGGESCDDGNIDNNDLCSTSCSALIMSEVSIVSTYCGDGIIQNTNSN